MAKKKILIVDNEPHIRALIARILEKDYTLLSASNGQEAIDASLKYQPDLILMDFMMPGVDGYTACSAIKTNPATSKIPVIMLTRVDFQLNKEMAKRMGANGYLTKPFNLADLMKTIGQFLPKTERPDMVTRDY